ncbi:L-aspartate oxidase [Rhodococcus sovatensis]|uniref:L-aspartate oxidase n=1 Tax=Rhodococcus sovatensis TaxID=1805840 RepID=A0ABZ2PV35_9NOCA
MTPEVSVHWERSADLVVVGGGVAGLSAARAASRAGSTVLTVAKTGPSDTSTQYAQGGIAVPAEFASADAIGSHVYDTCEAGGGLCDPVAVRSIVAAGPDAVATLESFGAKFDRGADGGLARTREGGHRVRRIIHAGGDATGAEVQRALDITSGMAHSGEVLFGTTAVRVLTTDRGVVGLLVHSGSGYGVIHCPAVLLATGGLGQLYSCSTNPPGATADGISLALDAGADVADLEFVQFHPTVLYEAGSTGRRPLVSEAVRGEGAHLVDLDGQRFMEGVHPLADLAPRDVVSRAIAERLRITGTDHVLLDARSIDDFHTRFPTVAASALAAGIDPLVDLVPVAPAAHYSCGGIVTDVWGRTGVDGLYAAGEVARTGMHGANRLASNSLLEGLVLGRRAGAAAAERRGLPTPDVAVYLPSMRRLRRPDLQQLMTEHVGVVRDADGLAFAASALSALAETSADDADGIATSALDPTVTAFEDSALTLTASALVTAAAERKESRGCHTRRDHPTSSEDLRHSIRIRLGSDGELESRPSPIGDTHAQTMTGVS